MTDLSSRNFEGLEAFAFEPRKVDKPWGYELIWAHAEDLYVGKILFVREGHALSLQFHREKDETIYVQHGRVEFTIGEAGDAMPNTEVVAAGCAFRVKPGTIHRMHALEDSTLLEVSTPQLDDVVRLEDLYGRTSD
jgi:mannose-6-phosphate isomerase-like protein (cupin superfamily)